MEFSGKYIKVLYEPVVNLIHGMRNNNEVVDDDTETISLISS